jgi:hypothetical protein
MTLETFQQMVFALWPDDTEDLDIDDIDEDTPDVVISADPMLYTINMTNDGAHHYIYGQQDLTINLNLGIIKIKYYTSSTPQTPQTNRVADLFLFCEGITGFTMKKIGGAE